MKGGGGPKACERKAAMCCCRFQQAAEPCAADMCAGQQSRPKGGALLHKCARDVGGVARILWSSRAHCPLRRRCSL